MSTVLMAGLRGLRGRGAVATSCALVAFLHGGAGVSSRIGLAVNAVVGVANRFAGTWGRPSSLDRLPKPARLQRSDSGTLALEVLCRMGALAYTKPLLSRVNSRGLKSL